MKRLLIMLALVLAVAGCSIGEPEPEKLSAGEVEAAARVVLPPGTVLLTAVRDGFQDWHITASLRLAPAAVPAFLSDSGLPQPTPGERSVHDHDRPDSDTWHPDAAPQVSGARDLHGGVSRAVLLDRSRSDSVTVYLVAFSV